MHQVIDSDAAPLTAEPEVSAFNCQVSAGTVTTSVGDDVSTDYPTTSQRANDLAELAKRVKSDRIAKRAAHGSLFGKAIQRYAMLFTQNDHDEFRRVVHRTLQEFRQLCPPDVSEVELVAAERVALARLKTLVFDLMSLTPEAWGDHDEFIEKRQTRAAKELDRAMRAYMQLRKVAASQPGFRWTLAESETTSPNGEKTTTRSVRVEQVDDFAANTDDTD